MTIEKIYSRNLHATGTLFWLGPQEYSVLPYQPELGERGYRDILVARETVKIGIISDIQQNTSALSAVLDMFDGEAVDIVMALGDYSFVPPDYGKADPHEIRATQFSKSISLLSGWKRRQAHRHVVVMIVNHEVNGSYFVN